MEDSPNEVQNIPSPTKIEEVDLLKAENTKTKRNLMWKVRKLEKDKILPSYKGRYPQRQMANIFSKGLSFISGKEKE